MKERVQKCSLSREGKSGMRGTDVCEVLCSVFARGGVGWGGGISGLLKSLYCDVTAPTYTDRSYSFLLPL